VNDNNNSSVKTRNKCICERMDMFMITFISGLNRRRLTNQLNKCSGSLGIVVENMTAIPVIKLRHIKLVIDFLKKWLVLRLTSASSSTLAISYCHTRPIPNITIIV
jgi:hypothetical protein